MVIATSATATATATVDGLFAAVAVVESKGVEESCSPLPVTAGVLGMGAVRMGTVAERLGEADMIGVSQTMASVSMLSEETTLFFVQKSIIPT